ncbi:MAG: amidase [Alphaproteobacteria bacterium]
MTDLADLSAASLAKAYATKALSPVDVAKAVLARIETAEPKLNAMYRIHREEALAAAKASERRWLAGAALSAIDGVTVTVKENLATAGDPTPVGVPIADMTPAATDSPVPARLREAGAVILGKTTMPDYGMLSAGLSSLHGVTRNPWNLSQNPAGSSSGAGAAGAAGYGPLHIGTDIGGSIRLPACHCGLFGLKPSLGRVPISPPFMGRVAGPMTRSVKDAAILMTVISRPDLRDFMSLPFEDEDYARGLDRITVKGLRVGLMTKLGAGLKAEAAVVKAAEAAALALEKAGAIVEPLGSILDAKMLDGMCRFFEQRSAADLKKLPAAKRAKLLPYIVQWATHRADGATADVLMAAYLQVQAMREQTVRMTHAFDFVISPVAPIITYPAEWHSPTNDPTKALEHIPFTLPANMSEQPAASVPWSYDPKSGMPIGVQVMGRRFDDRGVMRLSRLLETLRPKQKPWPLIG